MILTSGRFIKKTGPIPFSHHEWKDFYDSSIQYISYKSKSENLDIVAEQSYYISRCLFISHNTVGAVRITDTESDRLKFLIETSIVHKCGHINDKGGSVYIKLNKGECIQYRICSFGSDSSGSGAYCEIWVSTSSPYINNVLDSTITASGDENNKGFNNVDLIYGKINIKSINISYSKLKIRNFYYCKCSYSSNISYSTFSNCLSISTTSSEASHEGTSYSPKYQIFFCHYFKNECHILIGTYNNLYINN